MKIALINENSQASKNKIIYDALCDSLGEEHEIFNYGMIDDSDAPITYVQAGLLAAILLNSGAVDYVITGCGTGEGALLALNSFPNVLCGHIVDATDAYLFSQINDGNAVSIGFAKGFGWGSELTLKDRFTNLFKENGGGGYPKERREPEQRNKKILDEVKKITHNNIIDILNNIDKEFLKEAVSTKNFDKYFFDNCKDKEICEIVKNIKNK